MIWKINIRISVGRAPGPANDDLGFEVVRTARVVRELDSIEICFDFTGEMRLEKVAIALGGCDNAGSATPC